MDDLLQKISSYNIFNYLVPGGLFYYICNSFGLIPTISEGSISVLVVFYGIGLILGRVSSLILEPVMRFVRIAPTTDYAAYTKAAKDDHKLETLVEVANMYRTLATGAIVIAIMVIVRHRFGYVLTGNPVNMGLAMLGTGVLFIVSFRKQSQYIVKRVSQKAQA